MKNVISLLLIFSLFVPSFSFACSKGCVGGECGTCTGKTPINSDGSAENPKNFDVAAVSTSSLEAMIKSRVPMVLIDCRSGGCVDWITIPGATLLPDTSTSEEIQKVIPDKKSLIVLYDGYADCCARKDLRKKMTEIGYSSIVDYPPGIRGWIAAGKDTVKQTKN